MSGQLHDPLLTRSFSAGSRCPQGLSAHSHATASCAPFGWIWITRRCCMRRPRPSSFGHRGRDHGAVCGTDQAPSPRWLSCSNRHPRSCHRRGPEHVFESTTPAYHVDPVIGSDGLPIRTHVDAAQSTCAAGPGIPDGTATCPRCLSRCSRLRWAPQPTVLDFVFQPAGPGPRSGIFVEASMSPTGRLRKHGGRHWST